MKKIIKKAYIPGELIALATFPGVIMHEIAHKFMCDIFGVPVYHVAYFNIASQNAGHVIHGKIDSIIKNLLIGLAPLFFNTLLCIIFTLPYSASLHIAGDAISYSFIYQLLWWVGISMGANAFPSNQDVENVSEIASNNIIIYFIKGIVRLLNFLSRIWIDIAYAYGISLILPYLIFG